MFANDACNKTLADRIALSMQAIKGHRNASYPGPRLKSLQPNDFIDHPIGLACKAIDSSD
jgi:hypothetical protein